MRFFEIVFNWYHDIIDWFKTRDDADMFMAAVAILILLRLIGYTSLSVFAALIYIMWFVSVGRNR